MTTIMSPSINTEEEAWREPGQKAVNGGVPNVVVNAITDAVELVHVGCYGRVPTHL